MYEQIKTDSEDKKAVLFEVFIHQRTLKKKILSSQKYKAAGLFQKLIKKGVYQKVPFVNHSVLDIYHI